MIVSLIVRLDKHFECLVIKDILLDWTSFSGRGTRYKCNKIAYFIGMLLTWDFYSPYSTLQKRLCFSLPPTSMDGGSKTVCLRGRSYARDTLSTHLCTPFVVLFCVCIFFGFVSTAVTADLVDDDLSRIASRESSTGEFHRKRVISSI